MHAFIPVNVYIKSSKIYALYFSYIHKFFFCKCEFSSSFPFHFFNYQSSTTRPAVKSPHHPSRICPNLLWSSFFSVIITAHSNHSHHYDCNAFFLRSYQQSQIPSLSARLQYDESNIRMRFLMISHTSSTMPSASSKFVRKIGYRTRQLYDELHGDYDNPLLELLDFEAVHSPNTCNKRSWFTFVSLRQAYKKICKNLRDATLCFLSLT